MSGITGEGVLDEVEEAARHWWLYLLTGIAWILFGFLVLSFDLRTVWGVAVFFAIGLIAGGVAELAAASVVPSWRWLHVLLGVASIGAGIVALAWPGATFVVLAAIIGWYLMLNGVMDIGVALLSRDVDDLWLMSLVLGVAQLLIGFWAIGYAERSLVLLAVWVAAAAIGRGLSGVLLAFGLHQAGRSLRRLDATAA